MTWNPIFGYVEGGVDLTDRRHYESTLEPGSSASGLPGFAYTSKKFADLEDEAIWTRNWVCIGTGMQIPLAGDMLPFTVGNHGIHVQRLSDGTLAGRFNFAQHGGCRSVPGQCQTGKKTRCSYTACGYSRDRGVLYAQGGQTTPEMGQYLGPDPARLHPVQVREWGPFLFVNLDPAAIPDLDPFRTLREAARSQVPSGCCRHVSSAHLECETNWKIPGIHFLTHGHPPHRDGPDLNEMAWHQDEDGDDAEVKYWAYSIKSAGDKESWGAGPGFVQEAGWTTFAWIYPNLLLSCFDHHVVGCVLQPTGPTSVLQRIDLFAKGPLPDGLREGDCTGLPPVWMHALEKDFGPVRAMQPVLADASTSALHAPYLNPMAAAFQRHLVQQILAKRTYFTNKPLYSAPGRALNAGR